MSLPSAICKFISDILLPAAPADIIAKPVPPVLSVTAVLIACSENKSNIKVPKSSKLSMSPSCIFFLARPPISSAALPIISEALSIPLYIMPFCLSIGLNAFGTIAKSSSFVRSTPNMFLAKPPYVNVSALNCVKPLIKFKPVLVNFITETSSSL